MFHPRKAEKISPTMWEVNKANVAFLKDGWYCSECLGEIFRIGGKKQYPCRHVRYVLRKEKIFKEIREQMFKDMKGGNKDGFV